MKINRRGFMRMLGLAPAAVVAGKVVASEFKHVEYSMTIGKGAEISESDLWIGMVRNIRLRDAYGSGYDMGKPGMQSQYIQELLNKL